tara:strand:+ start:5411 stop:5689 length:279 start_codon:yes stop_codon:yes gene_type:complete
MEEELKRLTDEVSRYNNTKESNYNIYVIPLLIIILLILVKPGFMCDRDPVTNEKSFNYTILFISIIFICASTYCICKFKLINHIKGLTNVSA